MTISSIAHSPAHIGHRVCGQAAFGQQGLVKQDVDQVVEMDRTIELLTCLGLGSTLYVKNLRHTQRHNYEARITAAIGQMAKRIPSGIS